MSKPIIKPIMVGVDGSAVSIAALRWAIEEAARRGTSVTAINAWHSDPTTTALNRADLIQLRPRAEVLDAQLKLLASSVSEATAGDTKVDIEQRLVEGQPGPALVRAAAEAALLVVGSHGHNRFYEAMLGSVSAYCVHHSPCPIVVIPDVRRRHEHAPAAVEAKPLSMGPLY